MKHAASREFFAYWDTQRGRERAPQRSMIAPERLRHLLGDVFVLGGDVRGYPVRVAGTRICALFGHDIKGENFVNLVEPESRANLRALIDVVAYEMLPTVAGLSAATEDGLELRHELLLLPFAPQPYTPASLTGLLACLHDRGGPLHDFMLRSWRHIHPSRAGGLRLIRRLKLPHGLTVYEDTAGQHAAR